MRGFEALGLAVAKVCSGHVFGLMGDGNMAFLSYMDHQGLSAYHSLRHEASAVSMAAGFARSSLQLGVCTVTHGPGFTNCLTALNAAVQDRVPLLLVVGELPSAAVNHAQRVDHAALAAVVGARSVFVDLPDEVAGTVRAAAREALDNRAPVVLQVSYEAMWGEGATGCETEGDVPTAWTSIHPPVDVGEVRQLAGLLRQAERPFILVGRGGVLSEAEDLICTLAARTGALIGTSLGAKGACADDPRSVGLIGGFAHPEAAALARDSDVILAVGASLNSFTTMGGALLRGPRVVQVDVDPSAPARVDGSVHRITGDAGDVLRQLLVELREAPSDDAAGIGRLVDAVRRCHDWKVEDASDELGLDPRTVVRTVDAVFPSDRTVVADGGHLIEWASRYLSASGPASWLPSLGAGSIGLSTSTALGAAIGSGKPTVVVVGDGSCMMSLSDLDDAVRARLPVCFLIINDRAYGAEVHKLRQFGLPHTLPLFETPSFADVARALGAEALTLKTAADLDGLRSLDWEGVLARGPLVLDALVTRNVVSERLQTKAPQSRRHEGAATAGELMARPKTPHRSGVEHVG